MNTYTRTSIVVLLAATLLLLTTSVVAAPGALTVPSFDALAKRATDSVNITLDSSILGLAAGFLDPSSPEDAAAREVISGLKGIYVRSYTFADDFAYPEAEVDMIRKQLSAPGWQRLVQVRNSKDHGNVDIYISTDQGKANGLAIIASEPREFTIVNIVGSIDLQKLHRIEGKFGIPNLSPAATK